jgi:hypothetical protein
VNARWKLHRSTSSAVGTTSAPTSRPSTPTSCWPGSRPFWVITGFGVSAVVAVVHGLLEPGDPARHATQSTSGAFHCTVAAATGTSKPCTTAQRTSVPSTVRATAPSTVYAKVSVTDSACGSASSTVISASSSSVRTVESTSVCTASTTTSVIS